MIEHELFTLQLGNENIIDFRNLFLIIKLITVRQTAADYLHVLGPCFEMNVLVPCRWILSRSCYWTNFVRFVVCPVETLNQATLSIFYPRVI